MAVDRKLTSKRPVPLPKHRRLGSRRCRGGQLALASTSLSPTVLGRLQRRFANMLGGGDERPLIFRPFVLALVAEEIALG